MRLPSIVALLLSSAVGVAAESDDPAPSATPAPDHVTVPTLDALAERAALMALTDDHEHPGVVAAAPSLSAEEAARIRALAPDGAASPAAADLSTAILRAEARVLGTADRVLVAYTGTLVAGLPARLSDGERVQVVAADGRFALLAPTSVLPGAATFALHQRVHGD